MIEPFFIHWTEGAGDPVTPTESCTVPPAFPVTYGFGWAVMTGATADGGAAGSSLDELDEGDLGATGSTLVTVRCAAELVTEPAELEATAQ